MVKSIRFGKIRNLCIIILGIFLLVGIPYILPKTYLPNRIVGLWDIHSSGSRPEPARNYLLLANSSTEDTFETRLYGAQTSLPAASGEIHLNVSSGVVNLYIFDYNNYEKWKAKQPYIACLEVKNTGTANFNFLLQQDTNPGYLILMNTSPMSTNVTISGKLWLVRPLMGSDPAQWALLPISMFLGFCLIVGGMILALKHTHANKLTNFSNLITT